MATSIRRIAIYVDASVGGGYRWFLIEQAAKSTHWAEIRSADEPTETYREAMAAGLLALQAMIDDLDAGPRDAADAKAAPKRPCSHFGFGDLPD